MNIVSVSFNAIMGRVVVKKPDPKQATQVFQKISLEKIQ